MDNNNSELASKVAKSSSELSPITPNMPKRSIRAKISRHRKAAVDWTQILANMTIIVGLAIAIGTYLNEINNNNIEKTERRLALFQTDNLVKARSLLVQLWEGQNLTGLNDILSRKSIDALVERTIAKHSGGAEQIDEAIINIADFLDDLGSCRRSELCDADIVDDRMGMFAQDFLCTYQGKLESLRKSRLLPNLGQDLTEWTLELGECSEPRWQRRN